MQHKGDPKSHMLSTSILSFWEKPFALGQTLKYIVTWSQISFFLHCCCYESVLSGHTFKRIYCKVNECMNSSPNLSFYTARLKWDGIALNSFNFFAPNIILKDMLWQSCTSLSFIQFHQDMCCKKLVKDFKTDLVSFSNITFNKLPFVTVTTFLPAFRISTKMTSLKEACHLTISVHYFLQYILSIWWKN